MRINETRKLAKMIEGYESQSGGTTDYEELTNKPSINGVTVEGALTSTDLGIGEETILLNADMSFIAGGDIEITDTAEQSKIDRYIELVRSGKKPRLGFTMASPLSEGEVIFGYPAITTVSYPETLDPTNDLFRTEGIWLTQMVGVNYFALVREITEGDSTYNSSYFIHMQTLMQIPTE